jgi:hypothetical protein
MAFKADRARGRTWDPDTGWELYREPAPPMYAIFRLNHPEHAQIRFNGKYSVEDTGRLTSEGRQIAQLTYRIDGINERLTSKATAAQKQLIEAALRAYGFLNDGPNGDPFEVIFEN